MDKITDKKWVGVYQFAKKHNKSRQQVYLDIRLEKIPKERVRKAEIKVVRLQILDES